MTGNARSFFGYSDEEHEEHEAGLMALDDELKRQATGGAVVSEEHVKTLKKTQDERDTYADLARRMAIVLGGGTVGNTRKERYRLVAEARKLGLLVT